MKIGLYKNNIPIIGIKKGVMYWANCTIRWISFDCYWFSIEASLNTKT